MHADIRVAAVDLDSASMDIRANLDLIDKWVGRAAASEVQLVLFPELSLSGFLPNHPQGDHASWLKDALAVARRTALRLDAAPLHDLAAVAERHGIAISCGLLEDAGPLLYNTQVVVDQSGVVGRFRKMHIPMFEMPFYQGGEAPTAVDIRGALVSTNICFDALLPESTRLAALAGAEVVLFHSRRIRHTGTAAAWSEWALPAVRARCAENGIFGIAANYRGTVSACGVGQTFPGGLAAIGPRGEVLAHQTETTDRPQLLVVDLVADDLAAARAEPEFLFRFRRPELYGPLAE